MYVSSVFEDGQQINFDMKRIKVSVSDPRKRELVVKLNRLTEDEISEHNKTRINSEEEKSKTNHTNSANISITPSVIMTRSKKQQLIGSGEQPNIIELPSTSKRKLDAITSCMGNSSKNSGIMPNSEKIPSSEQSDFTNTNNAQTKEENSVTTVATVSFNIDETVWGKLRGSPHWPAKIIAIEGRRYEVRWYNDDRTSKLFLSQIFKFRQHFKRFSVKFPTSVGLEDAAKHALIHLMFGEKKNA